MLKQKQKKEAALKQKKKKKAETEKKKKGAAKAERKRGLEQIIFQHLFSFKSSQKNYGEFIYVGFNF